MYARPFAVGDRRENGAAASIVNSGCWLRQLQPIQAHFRGPPVFVSKFVQTHVRIFLGDYGVRVELWEHPKPARVRASGELQRVE